MNKTLTRTDIFFGIAMLIVSTAGMVVIGTLIHYDIVSVPPKSSDDTFATLVGFGLCPSIIVMILFQGFLQLTKKRHV